MEPEEYRRTSLETWSAMAPGWERWREEIESTSAPVREWLIRELAPQAGDTVLELAAGPGDTGFAVAPMIGEQGRLISSDFSPEMVEVARRRGEELGLTNVEHRVIDAESIDLEDDSVDGVICRFGYMLMPDPARALSETRRVLRPGGRLVLAVWRGSEHNPWISIAGRMLVERDLMPPPQPGEPGIFALANEERVRALVESAGFAVARMEDVPVRFVYDDIDDYVTRAQETGGNFARIWREASEDDRAAMRAHLQKASAPFFAAGGYAVPGLALVASAS